MILLLFIAASIAYGAATVVYGLERTHDPAHEDPSSRMAWLARLFLLVGALVHLVAIGVQCGGGDHPLKNIFLATSFGALISVYGYLALSRGYRLDALGAVMAPVGLTGLVLGVVFSGMGRGEIPGAEGIASAHVAFASTGLAGFVLAACVAGLYLVVERRLRSKRFRPGQGGMSLTGLDKLHHRLVLLVTPVFTVAIVTGVLWILEMGGPERLSGRVFEIIAAGVAWVACVAILVARVAWGTRGRRSAWLTLIAFVAIVLIVVSYGVRT